MSEHQRDESLAALIEQISQLGKVDQGSAMLSGTSESESLLLEEINRELLATSAALNTASCSLIALDPDSGTRYLRIVSAFGPGSEKISGLRIPPDQGIAGLVFKHRIPHTTNNLQGDAHFAPSVARKADLVPCSMVTVPVVNDGEALGLVQFINRHEGKFCEADTALAAACGERVAPLVNRLLNRPPEEHTFEGVRECSIIFTDITNYGRVANASDLPVTSKLLNEYLNLVCEVAISFGFWIDKFLGDGVMLVGNAPRQRAEYALDAIRLAQEAEQRMTHLVEEWIRFGLDAPIGELRSRIGIATGRVYLGNLGHPQAHWYTAVGPSVNLAWRLLEHGRRDRNCILICPRTRELVGGAIRTERLELGYTDISSEPGVGYRVLGADEG